MGYAFVDDTDLIQTAHDQATSGDLVIQELQRVAKIWEGGLHASEGALVAEKSH